MNRFVWNKRLQTATRICKLSAIALLGGAIIACSDDYDDSVINNRLDELEQRIDQLEEDITTQVNSLKQLVEGKTMISSWSFDEETGIYTVLLSDGSTLSIAQADESSPRVGVAQDENGYYWTLNGEPLFDGDRLLYVSGGSAPSIRVNDDTGEWEISADGGKTYLSTGIKAGDNASLIAKVEDDNGYVYFTLSDGTQLRVAKDVDYQIAALASKQYFEYNESRNVKFSFSGVKKTAVFSKPDGWKASVSAQTLTIKAPVSQEAGEAEGAVIVQAWFNDGTSDIAEVKVGIGVAPHVITIDGQMNISISGSSDLENDDTWTGTACGATKFSEFSEKWVMDYIEMGGNRVIWDWNMPLKSSLKTLLGVDPEKGESYVVWAIDKFDNGFGSVSYSEVIYTVVTIPDVKIEVDDVTFEDALISVVPKGVDMYYGGVFDTRDSNMAYVLDGINNYGDGVLLNGPYEGLLSKYAPMMQGASNTIRQGRTYCVYVIPYAGRVEYTEKDVIFTELTIGTVKTGGTAVVSVGDVKASMTGVTATVTRGAGVYKYYAAYMSNDKLEMEYTTDEKLLAYLSGQQGQTGETFEVTASNLLPETKGWILAVGVDKAGKAGEIVKKEANTSTLMFSDIKLSQPTLNVGINEATFVFPAIKGIKRYKYLDETKMQWSNFFLWTGDEAKTESALAIQASPNTYYKFIDAKSDGSLELHLEDRMSDTEYVLFVMGIDDVGNPTHMVRVDYIPQIPLDKFVKVEDPNYDRVKVVSVKVEGKSLSEYTESEFNNMSGFKTVEIEVTVPQNCVRYWVLCGDEQYVSGVGARQKTASVMTNFSTHQKLAEETTIGEDAFFNGAKIFIVWEDTEGKYYQYQRIDPKTLVGK